MEHAVKGGWPVGRADKGFLRTIAGSFAAHLVILAVALFIYKGPRRYFVPPVYTVNLIEPGSGGPKSAAPRVVKHIPEPVRTEPSRKEQARVAPPLQTKTPKAAKAAARPVEVKSKDTVSLRAAVKKLKADVREKEDNSLIESSIKRFKEKENAAALERRVEALKKGLTAGIATARGGKGQGTGGAESGSGGGISRGNVDSKYKAYYSTIRDRVQAAWVYPEGFESRKVAIIVSVRIARSGQLLDSWVNESSGNPRFDASLLDAIKKASPFPPLPADYDGTYLETGFRFCHPPCE